MRNPNDKPILVTGSHRSGSTWVGQMLALPSSVAYIHEPFNLYHRPGICKAKFDHWFSYVCDQNESLYLDDLESTLRFKYSVKEEVKVIGSAKDVLRLLRDYGRFTSYRLFSKRPLVKDPIAIFSAVWLAQKFNMDVVVLIRHPAAFVGSIKIAHWPHPFSHFLSQRLLMKQYLDKYRSDIEEYSKREKDIVDQAILLWNLIHHTILIYREEHPGWFFLQHEELSRDPVQKFSDLYRCLGLPFSKGIQRKIESFSRADPKKQRTSLRRDSRSNIMQWKARLTVDEIKRIKEGTHEIASEFYTEEDWGCSELSAG